MSLARFNIRKTKDIPNPNHYVTAIQTEYAAFAYDEVRAELMRGSWREKAFETKLSHPMDLEIGTGNGFFFAHRATTHPERCLVGMELKFKPLVQSIRRALNAGARNARIVRYHGHFLQNLFAPGELDHVFVHHPDPWTQPKKHKHRLLSASFLMTLSDLQKPGSYLDFKTDSEDYFRWAVKELAKSPFEIERYTEDLHRSAWSGENFTTHFERIFISKGQPIFYLRAFQK